MDDMGPYFDELYRDARKLVDQIEEATRHWRDKNYPASALVLGLMHYPVGQINAEISGLMKQYRENGVSPDDALKP
jgi:hypothetical protein